MMQSAEIKKYDRELRSSVLFQNLSDDEAEKAFEILCAKFAVYSKGELICRPYSEMKMFGLVVTGAVQACMDDVDGNRMIMAEVAPGVTFGESLCFLGIKNSPVYIYASESAGILWLSHERLFCDEPDALTVQLQRRFTAMLATRTLAMNDRIQVLSKIRLRDKLMTYFSQLSKRNKARIFNMPMNRNDLAAYLGTDRSALSRELSNLKKEGLIDYRGKTVKIIR